MDMEIFLRDLASRFDAHRREEMEALVDELADAERTEVSFASRLTRSGDAAVNVVVRGGRLVTGRVIDAAATWAVVRAKTGDVLIPMGAVVAAWPLGSGSPGTDARVAAKIGIGHVLRELAARGAGVGIDHDAGRHQGRIVAVYGDHLDLETTVGNAAVDSRDMQPAVIISLSLSGLRALDVAGERWG